MLISKCSTKWIPGTYRQAVTVVEKYSFLMIFFKLGRIPLVYRFIGFGQIKEIYLTFLQIFVCRVLEKTAMNRMTFKLKYSNLGMHRHFRLK